jgi:hypothetical protein
VLDSIDPNARRLLEPVIGLPHFPDWIAASWLGRSNQPHPVFCGRSALIKALWEWADGHGPPLQVVTGRPGSGKSAVLAALVCSKLEGVPDGLRAAIAGQDPALPVARGLAVVHARNQLLEEVPASLAQQWRLEGASGPGLWTVENLIQALRSQVEQPCLVLDALDEAQAPEDLARVLLERLVTEQRPDRRPVCRLLLGVRSPDHRFSALLDRARSADDGSGFHDLDRHDAADREDLRGALEEYLGLVLGLAQDPGIVGERHGPTISRPVRAEFARVSLEGLLTEGSRTGRNAVCGEFLLATLHVRTLLQLPDPPSTPEQARELAEDLLRLDLRGILDQDLQLIESKREPGHEWARPVATLLARAAGNGINRDTLTGMLESTEIQTRLGVRRPPTIDEINNALEDLRFFLSYDVDEEGTRLYRLFHQDLIDALKRRPLDPRAGGT